MLHFYSDSMASVVFCSFISSLRLYSKKNMGMGPYAGVDYNSHYLIVNSVVLSIPTQKGKGGVGKVSPIG
jgi:hypothetical protein